jgi:hypothetical protein
MRGRLTYANVAATLALFLSMSGGALAASHYLVNSTKQINPKVLKKLMKAGKTGATGKEGPAGKEGKEGKEGKQGNEGAAGSAVAYAHILGKSDSSSPLDASNSKNVTAASEPFTGGYCITTSVPIKNISGGVADFDAGGNTVTVTGNFSFLPEAIKAKTCPAGTTALVETDNAKAEATAADFWISFN